MLLNAIQTEQEKMAVTMLSIFTLDEIKGLKFTGGFDIVDGKKSKVIQIVSQWEKSDFRIHTFKRRN